MKKLLIWLLTFVLILCAAPLPVLAFDIDYSELEPDENGKYWIYMQFVNDSYKTSDGATHSADVDIYIDVTGWYELYGHAGLSLYQDTNNNRIMTRATEPNHYYGSTTTYNWIVEGVLDGKEVSGSITGTCAGYFDFEYVCGLDTVNNSYMLPEYIDSFKYVPIYSDGFFTTDEGLYYDYIQKKPAFVFNPQEATFNYVYNSDGEIKNFNIYLRYKYPTVADFYNNTNALEAIPYVEASTAENVNTLVNFRLTAIINNQEVITEWLPLKDVSYYPNSGADFVYPNYSIFDYGALFAIFYADDSHYVTMDFDCVPTLLNKLGLCDSKSSVLVKSLELTAQNHNTVTDVYSDLVYSAYDFYDNTVSNGVVNEVPENNDNGVPDVNNITINNIIPTDNTATPPVINNTVNEGDVTVNDGDVIVNNNVPGDIDLNINVTPDGDDGTGIFGWLADKAADAADTVEDIDTNFNRLITNVNTFVGRFPSLFSWVIEGLPADYVLWLELGIAVTVAIVVIKKVKIW